MSTWRLKIITHWLEPLSPIYNTETQAWIARETSFELLSCFSCAAISFTRLPSKAHLFCMDCYLLILLSTTGPSLSFMRKEHSRRRNRLIQNINFTQMWRYASTQVSFKARTQKCYTLCQNVVHFQWMFILSLRFEIDDFNTPTHFSRVSML